MGFVGGEECVYPLDHDTRDHGHSGGLGRTHANGGPSASDGWLRSALENSPEILTVVDADGTLRYASPAFGRVFGHDPEEVVGEMNVFDHVHPDDLPRVLDETEGILSEGGAVSNRAEYRFRHKDGSWRWVEGVGTYLPDDPAVRGVVVSARDITERKEAEGRLRAAEERYRAVVETQTELVCRFLPDFTVTFANEAYCRYFGLRQEETIGKSFIARVAAEDRGYYGEELARLDEETPSRTVEHRVLTPDGRVRWQQWTDTAIFDDAGRLVEYQSVGRDVTDRRELEERLAHQALHDSLTGLPNRRLYVDRLGQALRRNRRRKKQAAVLFMDLDNFKSVNDSLGHEAGDLMLVMVAERLKGYLRPEDTLARFGGDEFVVLIDDVDGPDAAVRVAERIVAGFGAPFSVEGRELYARASIGIALGGGHAERPEDVIGHADMAMYRAKDEGSGRYSVFDPAMAERAIDRLETENDLRRAVERGEFVIHYQPIVRLDGGEACTVEALVRWQHPERGLLGPDEFVPLAERSGLVVPMGEQVLREACLKAKGWQEEHPRIPPLVASVNLSAVQFGRHDLAEVVGETLRETGWEARCLSLDVTETVYVKALEGNTGALNRLRAMGVGISIDDFGTGYSSLSYLKRLPADALKIDKSFVKNLGEDVEDTAIVEMVVELAHTLGMEVVAEGVETEGQASLLKEMGCDMAQGFHFSEPLPPKDVPGFLVRG